jgi:3-methylcrotonyl-CoA carboxylase alpha subunit
MFKTLLIANRGEIACRIIRTARRMGLRSIAVFSEADAAALHVREADEAYPIGPAPAAQSYLRGDVILEVARRAGAEAIHPGYGFLSENAEFAEACAAAGVSFIGPSPAAIRAMGSKAEAKRIMVAAGVPTVPGYHGDGQDDALLAAEAARIGFPVLIKASAGGGGKGMRPVLRAEDFAAELAGARREAKAAFGDDRVLLEKYLQRPRHVEVQVFGDSHGRITHLHSRDCSLQRRHQKVVEEAPAPALSAMLRAQLHEAAESAARAVGYTNAGTVEFIVEDGQAYFLEMNTRLQVEHPVTEMITGLDLVEWQLRVAAGEALPVAWPPAPHGHAVEVRLYAEDPAEDFRPSIGRLNVLQLVSPDAGRIDAGVLQGDAVSSHYDPMIAKLIAWGESREAAVRSLQASLAQARIVGVTTNAVLLRRLLRDPVLHGEVADTGHIARHAERLLQQPEPAPDWMVACVVADYCAGQGVAAANPWARRDSWRVFGTAESVFRVAAGGAPRQVVARPAAGIVQVSIDGGCALHVKPPSGAGHGVFTVDGVLRRPAVSRHSRTEWRLVDAGEPYEFALLDPYAPAGEAAGADHRLSAPIPGRVVQVLVAPGDAVKRGDILVIIEAMKTELRITAPRDGTVEALGCAMGEGVEEGTELVTLAAPSA